MGTKPNLVWVREPLQARSQATLTRLLDATEVLLDDTPFDVLTVQAICKEARSSVGAFYTRFADKTSLLHLLHERACDQSKKTAVTSLAPALWVGLSLREILAAVVDFIVVEYRAHPGVRLEVIRRNGLDLEFRRRSSEVADVTAGCIRVLLEERRSEMSHPNPVVAAEMLHRIIFSVLDQHLVFGTALPTGQASERAAGAFSDDDLARELTATVIGYLGVKG